MTTPETGATTGRIVDPSSATGSRLAKMMAETMRRSGTKGTGKPRTMGFLPVPEKQTSQRAMVVVCRVAGASLDKARTLLGAGADAVELDLAASAATISEAQSLDAPIGLSMTGLTGAAYTSWRDELDNLALDWITLAMDGDARFLGKTKPARMLRLPISAPIETVRTIATNVVQLVTICADGSTGQDRSVADLLRIAYLCEAVRKPMLIEKDLVGDADSDYLMALQECGVGGIVLDAATPKALAELLTTLST